MRSQFIPFLMRKTQLFYAPARLCAIIQPCGELAANFLSHSDFLRYWDAQAQAPWLFNGSTLISYEDPDSLRAKCAYVLEENLLGIMYWEHGCDPTRQLLATLADALVG